MSILEKIMKGERITKKVTVQGEPYEIAYPLKADTRAIEYAVAQVINESDTPASSFPEQTIRTFRVNATVDQLLVSKPSWWQSAEDCFDDSIVVDLYVGIRTFQKEVQDDIKRARSGSTPADGKSGDAHADVGAGAFSGITGGSAARKS